MLQKVLMIVARMQASCGIHIKTQTAKYTKQRVHLLSNDVMMKQFLVSALLAAPSNLTLASGVMQS